MADTPIEQAWQDFLDAIAEADFIAEEIVELGTDDPGHPTRVIAWHEACARRDAARDRVRQLMGSH